MKIDTLLPGSALLGYSSSTRYTDFCLSHEDQAVWKPMYASSSRTTLRFFMVHLSALPLKFIQAYLISEDSVFAPCGHRVIRISETCSV